MNNLNSILIEGNLVKDPVLRSTPNGTPVCLFSVATNRFFKQNDELQKEVSYFDIESWAATAQTCGSTLTKGRGVRVVGRLKQDRWNDENGAPKVEFEVNALDVPWIRKGDKVRVEAGNMLGDFYVTGVSRKIRSDEKLMTLTCVHAG